MKFMYGLSFFFLGMVCNGFSQKIILKQSNESGIYQSGEKIRVYAIVREATTDSFSVSIRKNFSPAKEQKRFRCVIGKILLMEEAAVGPATMQIQVVCFKDTTGIGLIIDPDKFRPALPSPDDLDAFWEHEKKLLHALPIKTNEVAVNINNRGFQCVDMEINCTGNKSARGYLVRPMAAKPRSLPIVIYLHSAGVMGSWSRSQTALAINFASIGRTAISFDLNAHGMLNGQDDAYYAALDSGELKNYPYQGMRNRNDYYFKNMYLRIIRTIDYLTGLPEWDGKNLLLIGESQGGGQALAAAGLDNRVTAVLATLPAMCNWGATLFGSKGGWPDPFATQINPEPFLKVIPYFDVANLISKSKARIMVEIGLMDDVCPSSSIYAAINQCKGKKTVLTVPYRSHRFTASPEHAETDRDIAQAKNEFLYDFFR